MKTLKHLLLLMFLGSTVLTFAQDEDKYKNIRKKDYDQKDQYDDGDYLFPPQPKNNWSIGAKAGAAFVSGDVKKQPGAGFAVDVRKAMGHVFGLRFQVGAGQATGLNYQPANGYRNHNGNPWDALYYPGRVNAIDGSETAPYVYYNYRMRYGDAAIQGIVNLNNINFYKEQNQWNIYAAAGVGVMAYNTKVDAGTGDAVNPYDFSSVSQIPIGNNSLTNIGGRRERLDALRNIMDFQYETPAEGHTDETGLAFGGDNYVVNPYITGAVGLRYRLGRRVELELEHRIAWTNDDLLDGQRWQETGVVGSGVAGNHSVSAQTRDFDSYSHTTLGIHFRIGPGEESLWWSNPLSEVYSSAQEAREIVKKLSDDSDNDGVPDLYDKEPDTPEGSPVDGQGRTLDSDGDGYPDTEDGEPFTPKGCDVDDNGVAIDADNDGVPDCFDKEPNSPPGMYYDAKGVAIQMPTNMDINSVTNMGGNAPCLLPIIHFDLDKDIIKPEFYPELYYIAQVMKANTELRVKATGHADVRNTNAYNDDLSMRRVRKAVDFLVSTYGIDPNRFDMEFQGEENTVIKNLPDQGSSRKLEPLHYVNRRVEFECVQN